MFGGGVARVLNQKIQLTTGTSFRMTDRAGSQGRRDTEAGRGARGRSRRGCDRTGAEQSVRVAFRQCPGECVEQRRRGHTVASGTKTRDGARVRAARRMGEMWALSREPREHAQLNGARSAAERYNVLCDTTSRTALVEGNGLLQSVERPAGGCRFRIA